MAQGLFQGLAQGLALSARVVESAARPRSAAASGTISPSAAARIENVVHTSKVAMRRWLRGAASICAKEPKAATIPRAKLRLSSGTTRAVPKRSA